MLYLTSHNMLCVKASYFIDIDFLTYLSYSENINVIKMKTYSIKENCVYNFWKTSFKDLLII